jgi:hypothetical protein
MQLIKFKRNFPVQTVWRAASVCFNNRPSAGKQVQRQPSAKLINR